MKLTSFLVIGPALLPHFVRSGQMGQTLQTEEERRAKYDKAGYTWPITEFWPNTPGWNKIMAHRIRQIDEMPDRLDRFEGFAQTLSAALIQPNYTEHGFGLARAPDDLMEALRQGIREGLEAGPRIEEGISAIYGDKPWFIDRPDLTARVLKELQHYPEAWAGIELTPEIAYGFRLYRNQSKLFVHVDKPETHVISFILHIDSSEDAEPWPIIIEDYHGQSHEFILTSGDLLFYESSKCFHGRPRHFNGSWYSSIFAHYYPKYGYRESFDWDAKVNAIPPHWEETPTTHYETLMKMYGTTFDEPTCPNGWCETKHAKQWKGPGEEGVVIAPTGERIPFDPSKAPCMDKDPKCPEWAKWGSDECEKNKKFMLQFCAKSCGVCSAQQQSKQDEL